MGKGNYLITVEKQKNKKNKTKLLSEEISTLERSKEFFRDHRTIKKAVENFNRDEHKLKLVFVKQQLLTSTQIFEKAEIESVKKDKRYIILSEMGSVKNISLAISSHYSKYFKTSKLVQERHEN